MTAAAPASVPIQTALPVPPAKPRPTRKRRGHARGAFEKPKPRTAGQHVITRLEKALATYRERNAVYQDSFKRWGPVFEALFPKGVHVATADEWNRITTLGHIIDKLVRYTTDFSRPHEDSIHDLGVYAFILQGIDAEIAAAKETK